MSIFQQIEWHYQSVVATSGSDHLRDVFGHMGLSDKDIVVLSGAHTLVC